MIKILSLLSAAAVLLLSGCTVHQSIGDSFGSYVAEPDGQSFRPVGQRWDYEHTALLYVYRPATGWSMDELESPSFNVADERLFNVKGGGYTWYEMQPGSYDIVMRRGLLGLEGIGGFDLKVIARLVLDVQVGKVYYLRYSEVDPPQIDPEAETVPLGDGPLQLVSPALAMTELPLTHMIHHGRGMLTPEQAPQQQAAVSPEQEADTADEADTVNSGGGTKGGDWWPF